MKGYQVANEIAVQCHETLIVNVADREWKSVYAIKQRKKPPSKAHSLNSVIKMIASLGAHLGRKHDGEPGPQVMWIGMQRLRDFVLAWEIFPRLKQ